MADARALLRAHRSENRIKHPQAAYSDAGKLLCKLCHEHIRSESLWDAHTRSANHQTNLKVLQQQQQQQQQAALSNDSNPSAKRKLDDVEDDDDMDDAADSDEAAASLRAKRSKTGQDGNGSTARPPPTLNTNNASAATGATREKTISPPILGRRASNTPVQGVEIAIPSRPATPLARSDSATSTPNITIAASSRSPLASIEDPAPGRAGASGTNNNNNSRGPISIEALQIPSHVSRGVSVSSTAVQPPTPLPERIAPASAAAIPAVDESEWAAFEADIASAAADDRPASASTAPAPVAAASSLYADATISAPAMTKAELEAKSQEEMNEQRKQLLDAQIAGEKEDAARALEEEFDEMEELEGRVKRLKERREQLRKGSLANIKASAADAAGEEVRVNGKAAMTHAIAEGKENGSAAMQGPGAGEDEDEDDEDEEEDEWDGFRFRA
ncbi:uncharacterized protein B0I36DRAFT_328409 [Microdochium trichocladiopsis]|uniref:Coiled-coil domain-containing protein 16 n=1 Tax=Microdochium trichocladiopsis TaxID=1682393 RepID=A0A9P8Y5H0_9PEZI|nr:uncharacterized protein B0I36DRAFT_328409 [Microdochium trichocladiopsis]KAH7027995.1 hypothetical protein B0I36DRAFT_328409 [Microdochium trichocladiopsis]